MKKIIQDSEYAEISYDSDLYLGKIVWKKKTTATEYQYAIMTLLAYAKINRIDNFLSDIRKQAAVSPENRAWFETELLPDAINAGLKRIAVVFDGNVLKKHYLNMILKITNKLKLPMKTFLSEQEAISWFIASQL